MKPKPPYVIRLGRVRRAAEERGELLDPLHVVMLGLPCELADRHVFDHAPTQRTDSLLGHGDAPVLSEVFKTPHLKTGRPGPLWPWPRNFAQKIPRAHYSASGLVHWPEPEATLATGGVRCLGSTCRQSVGP